MADIINALIANPRQYPQWNMLNAMKDINAIRGQEISLGEYPEERAWQLEQRGRERAKAEAEQRILPIKERMEKLKAMVTESNFLTLDAYPKWREKWAKEDPLFDQTLPPPDFFERTAAQKMMVS